MKVIKTANGNEIKLSKSEWESIGKTAGWITAGKVVPVEKAILVLQQMFPGIHGIRAGVEGDIASEGQIHLGDAAEGGEIGELPAADYYSEDYEEKVYVMNVHKKLRDALDKLGYGIEWYDAGTLYAYPEY